MYNMGIKLTCALELLASSGTSWSETLLGTWAAEKSESLSDISLNGWEENHLQPDSEEWMNLSTEEIRKIMAEDKGEEEQVKEMIENLRKLMEGESGFEGIDDESVNV
jgi:hypothetical protein